MGLLDWLFRRPVHRNAPSHTTPAPLDAAIEAHERGELDVAEAAYRAILSRDAAHSGALHLLGVIAHQRGQHEAALEPIRKAIASNGSVALYHFNLGNVLAALGRTSEAAVAFAEAARLDPEHVGALCNLGHARLALKELTAAVHALRRAYTLAPDTPGLRMDLGTALLSLGDESVTGKPQFNEAIELFASHWRSEAKPAAARLMLAYALAQFGRWSEAMEHYEGILADPMSLPVELKAHSNAGNCCNQLGRMEDAVRHYREALRLNPDMPDTASSIAACINYLPGASPADVLDAHRDWDRRFGETLLANSPYLRTADTRDRNPANGRRLRIGYVSPDFRRHPVTALFAPVMDRHDRDAFEIYCYYNHRGSDEVTDRLRARATVWRDVAGLEHDALAAQIAADRIDILVDLAGHTALNRLPAFARKPAPILVEWLGYFTTTGIGAFDYFISDPHCSPPGQEAWFTERLVRLPHTRFCYEPYPFMPEVSPLPALTRGYVTFGCLNNLAKVNRDVLELWARVLAAVPRSRLALQAHALEDADNRRRFLGLASQCGIAAERIIIRPYAALREAAHAYHDIDIALDPFPFCGGMTSFESLWMGVPVVTRDSPLIAGRQTLSMLVNLGHPEWIARDSEAYAAIARQLAGDLQALAARRAGLRGRFRSSALMDHAGFTTALERAYHDMWIGRHHHPGP